MKKNCECMPEEQLTCMQCSRDNEKSKKEIKCKHKFFWCARHQLHIESYCVDMCLAI